MNAEEKAHEQVLVLRCQANDDAAFTELFERYHGPLKYYVRRLLESPETADDVLQSAWVKVLRKIGRLRQPEAFRVWLYRIARNEAFQILRRQQRWAEIEESLAEPVPEERDDAFAGEDAARVHAALEKLSPIHRDALVLRFLEDLSYQEIADVTGAELGTVRSRLYHGKRALRRILEEPSHDA